MDKSISVLTNVEKRSNGLLNTVYIYMFLGLLVTSVVSFFTAKSPTFIRLLYSNPFSIIVIFLLEMGLVFYLNSRIRTISVRGAQACFFLYSLLTGVTLSSIFLVYLSSTIYKAFFSALGVFLGATLYASITKRRVEGLLGYLTIGLFGLIIASLVNMFFGFSSVDLLICVLGVVIFTLLTVFDTKKILDLNREYGSQMSYEEYTKLGITSALSLYLDFINIFLYLLRLFSRSSRD